ncbi:MAG: hypothetical protein N2322_04085 [Terrimicrobiaceae bacterium]|nr:hypothetical protein [Terrimicrobiaceae bacterium]
MPASAIIIGALLNVVGLAGWILTEMKSWTALIPAILGLLLVLLGVVSLLQPGLRKHLMHAAMVVALVGLLGSGRMLMRGSDSTAGASPVRLGANGATTVLCVLFLGLGIRSFIQARRQRLAP